MGQVINYLSLASSAVSVWENRSIMIKCTELSLCPREHQHGSSRTLTPSKSPPSTLHTFSWQQAITLDYQTHLEQENLLDMSSACTHSLIPSRFWSGCDNTNKVKTSNTCKKKLKFWIRHEKQLSFGSGMKND